MIIGVPAETRPGETRVAATPELAGDVIRSQCGQSKPLKQWIVDLATRRRQLLSRHVAPRRGQRVTK